MPERRKTLVSIVQRYVHKRKQDSHQEDLEMLRLVKTYQEMTLKDLRELRGQAPMSPYRLRMGPAFDAGGPQEKVTN